jgi:membrane protease subunit HflC
VDAFARYRIENPVLFYQRVNNIPEANQRLSTFLQSSLRSESAKASFEAIVRDDRAGLMERSAGSVSTRPPSSASRWST